MKRFLFFILLLPSFLFSQETPEWYEPQNTSAALKLGYDSVVVSQYFNIIAKPGATVKPDTVFSELLPKKTDTIAVERTAGYSITKDDAGRVIYAGDTSHPFGSYRAYTYDRKGRVLTSKHCGEKGCVTWTYNYGRGGRQVSKHTQTRPYMHSDRMVFKYNKQNHLIDFCMYYDGELMGRRQYAYAADGLMITMIQSGSYYETWDMGRGNYRMEIRYFKRKAK